LVFNLLLYYSK